MISKHMTKLATMLGKCSVSEGQLQEAFQKNHSHTACITRWSTASTIIKELIMIFWLVMDNRNSTQFVSSYISLTWVVEKSTHCKNGQFFPSAYKDISVILRQPPKSMIFSSWQLSARARTPSSVTLQQPFKEISWRSEHEEATAFIPRGNTVTISELNGYKLSQN